MKNFRIICLAAIVALSLPGCSGVKVGTLFERGAVVSASPVASQVGVEIMRRGGNAFDAAVAVSFALAVVHPQAGNLGGGGFALVRDAKSQQIRALDFRETAPSLATDTMYLDDSGEVIENLSVIGAKAVAVPGTVAGLHELWHTYCSLPWDTLLLPAIFLADTGFLVNEVLVKDLSEHETTLRSFTQTERTFFPSGKLPQRGDRLVQKQLAMTLRDIAANGSDAFYYGQIASAIDSTMRIEGGLISLEDLASYRPIWRQPIHFTFDSLDIYSMPPPSSGGTIVGQILKILESRQVEGESPSSVSTIHHFCEAARLAYADRAVHLGDPDFFSVPTELLDKNYLDQRRKLIDSTRAGSSQAVSAGAVMSAQGKETTHFSVCDRAGNVVSLTTTLNSSFGSGLMAIGAGFLLNNEMDDFAIKPGHANLYGLVGGEANKIAPGKRMLSSMSPTIVMHRDQPVLVLGTKGGSEIITCVAKTIMDVCRFHVSLSEALALPRFHHQWLPDEVQLESGRFSSQLQLELRAMGHTVTSYEPISEMQALQITESGHFVGASDPRSGGGVAGF